LRLFPLRFLLLLALGQLSPFGHPRWEGLHIRVLIRRHMQRVGTARRSAAATASVLQALQGLFAISETGVQNKTHHSSTWESVRLTRLREEVKISYDDGSVPRVGTRRPINELSWRRRGFEVQDARRESDCAGHGAAARGDRGIRAVCGQRVGHCFAASIRQRLV